ncbi:MAG: hypothetical protein IPK32_14010 [Verrucomicrobiaceae bacterium]|nr:hypothetical protein [Verrucomicrobiaceae bacterium]
MTPAEIRQQIKTHAVSLAKAAQTGDAIVLNATETAFDLVLARLIPDKPTLTLADVEAARKA